MNRTQKGFTLVELLVVVAVIALLLGIVIPGMDQVRELARQVKGMSDQRQILLGYATHSHDRRNELLFGYAPYSVNGEVVTVTTDGRTYSPPVVNRYPWRLSPYVADVWDVLYSHSGAPDLPSTHDSDSEAFSKAYELSVSPSFGINSVYVGGHFSVFYKGFNWTGSTSVPNKADGHVVFNIADVRRPGHLIAFTEVQRRGGGAIADEGHYWATAPNAAGSKWIVNNGKFQTTSGFVIGLPKGRYRNSTITGFIDGHVETLSPDDLYDMTRWANDARDNSYDVP